MSRWFDVLPSNERSLMWLLGALLLTLEIDDTEVRDMLGEVKAVNMVWSLSERLSYPFRVM